MAYGSNIHRTWFTWPSWFLYAYYLTQRTLPLNLRSDWTDY